MRAAQRPAQAVTRALPRALLLRVAAQRASALALWCLNTLAYRRRLRAGLLSLGHPLLAACACAFCFAANVAMPWALVLVALLVMQRQEQRHE